uniref:Uncharacterized protein n=1 Tax=Oryza meridionalis TaxID=40149 RepID=A0A0E0D309_9ORYZ
MAAGLGHGQRWRTTQVGQPEEAQRHVRVAGKSAGARAVMVGHRLVIVILHGCDGMMSLGMMKPCDIVIVDPLSPLGPVAEKGGGGRV